MKKTGAEVAQLTPDPHGWRLQFDGKIHTAATLDEALALMPAKTSIQLAVPTPMALLERLTLPSTDREELAGMVQLQLEKTLPYPIEEVTSDFEVLNRGENESLIVTTALHEPALEQLCRPLKDQKRIPERITVFGQHVASMCPSDATVLAIWEEQEQVIVAICENGKLGWAQALNGGDPETLQAELPQLLLSAEMEGVPTAFTQVILFGDLARLEPVLRENLELPVETRTMDSGVPGMNLRPAGWTQEARGYEKMERLRQRLMTIAIVYLVLLACAFVYLAWTKRRVQLMDVQIADLQPQLQQIEQQRAKWNALAPAIDKQRYVVELLYQTWSARPSPELSITEFNAAPANFSIKGEAPSATLALEYFVKLGAEPALSSFKIEMPKQPALLPNDHAQFQIFGHL